MARELVALNRDCETCGAALFTRLPKNPQPKRFCSNACRYQAWKDAKEKELHDLIRQLAGRIAV